MTQRLYLQRGPSANEPIRKPSGKNSGAAHTFDRKGARGRARYESCAARQEHERSRLVRLALKG